MTSKRLQEANGGPVKRRRVERKSKKNQSANKTAHDKEKGPPDDVMPGIKILDLLGYQ